MVLAQHMGSFDQAIDETIEQAEALLADPGVAAQTAMPGRVFFLNDNQVLALPRDNGDSRYPYGQDGFNFWVYASGYMHCNEGLFSHFLRAAEGQEPQIAFFAGLPDQDGRFSIIPLMPVPRVLEQSEALAPDHYTVFSSSAAYFVTKIGPLRFVLRVFVTTERDVCFSLQIRNLSEVPQDFLLSSYFNPFLRHQLYETGEDRWFKRVSTFSSESHDQNQLGGFLAQVNEDKDRLSSVSHYGVIRRHLAFDGDGHLVRQEQTTCRYQYVGGSRSSLHTPAALVAGTFGDPQQLCTFTQTAIAGDLNHLHLASLSSARFDVVFNHTETGDQADELSRRAVTTDQIDAGLQTLGEDDKARHSGLHVAVGASTLPTIKPKVFNAFIEHLKRQVEFCSLIKGYVQLSPNSLIGIRDVFQALKALLFWRPHAVRAKMLEALGYTAPDGRCFRQYSLPSSTGQIGKMDLRPFIDQGTWVISGIAVYLRATGDIDFLNESCGYHEIIDEEGGIVRQSDLTDSVIDHLLKIMDYMLSNRDHNQTGCVRALYGDWNDALDGLGISMDPSCAYGSGVSVMATLQVYRNCFEMIEMLEALDGQKYWARVRELRDAADELSAGLKRYAVVQSDDGEKRILHGWGDKRSYLVGSFSDPDGLARDGLTSNAYWVLSGLHHEDPAMGPWIDKAFKRLDSKYGLKTFEPAFAEDVPGVGRIRKLPPGTAENGATYIHATAFAIMALFQMGQAREAWSQLEKILPFTDIHENLSHSPFVMPNSYGYNPDVFIDGQNMNDWQTGSSNVVLRTLILYVFGFEPAMAGLWVQPASWSPFQSFEFTGRLRGGDVRIIFEDRGGSRRSFTVNGQPLEASYDSIMKVDRLWIPNDQLRSEGTEIRVTQ